MITESGINLWGSETFVGLVFVFLVSNIAILNMLKMVRRINKLQSQQLNFLNSQKWICHSLKMQYFDNLNKKDDALEYSLMLNEQSNFYDTLSVTHQSMNIPPMLVNNEIAIGNEANANANANINMPPYSMRRSMSPNLQYHVGSGGSGGGGGGGGGHITHASQHMQNKKKNDISFKWIQELNRNMKFETSKQYFENLEKSIADIINMVQSQDITPRIYGFKIQHLLYITFISTTFAVIPTGIRVAYLGN